MTDTIEQPCTWQDVRVYYFADLDQVLTELIAPLFTELAGQAGLAYYQRHWLGGQHVRLSLSGPPDRLGSRLVPLALTRAREYLSANPSRAAAPSVADAQRWYTTLAPLEATEEADPGIAEDNSVAVCPHSDRQRVLGSAEAVAFFEDFHVASSRAALTGLMDAEVRANRLRMAVGLMVAIARDFPGGVRRGALSFRSHAEGAIMGAPDPAGLRSFLDGMSARACPSFAPFQAGLDTRHGPVPGASELAGAAEIYGTLVRAAEAARELVDNDLIRLPLEGPQGQTQWDPRMLRLSPFHERLQTSPAYLERMATDPDLRTYRVLVNFLYLHLARLGLRPIHRILAARLAADAIDRAVGGTAGPVESVGRTG